MIIFISSKKVNRVGGVEIKDKGLGAIKSIDVIGDGQVVGVVLPDVTTRAICSKSSGLMRLFLIDLGEELERLDEVIKYFQLDERQLRMPSQAIFSKVVNSHQSAEEIETFLTNMKLKNATYKVIDVKNHVLYVNLEPSAEGKQQLNPYKSPPRSQYSTCQSQSFSSSSSSSTGKTVIPKNPFLLDNEVPSLKQDVSEAGAAEKVMKKGFTITEEERELLFEETETTDNALKAVMGYIPQDDARLCKFYNGQEGSCFKGVHCKLVHQKPLEDGWTRDKVIVALNVPVDLPRLEIGEQAIVSVTYVETGRVFYGYLVSSSVGETGGAEFVSMQDYLNEKKVIEKHRPYPKGVSPGKILTQFSILVCLPVFICLFFFFFPNRSFRRTRISPLVR